MASGSGTPQWIKTRVENSRNCSLGYVVVSAGYIDLVMASWD
jgi:hypothetical protein